MLLTHVIDGKHGRHGFRPRAGWFVAMVIAFVLTGCGSPAVAPVTPTPATAVDLPSSLTGDIAVAGPALLQLERNAAAARDLAVLAQLWTDDARIVDGRNTADPGDDYVWSGHPAIMDRYRLAVFPVPPPPLDTPPAPTSVESAATRAVIVNGGDHWILERRDDRWYLQELAYQKP